LKGVIHKTQRDAIRSVTAKIKRNDIVSMAD